METIDFIGTMPLEKQYEHPEWHCVDFDDKTFVINNVFSIPARGGKPTILRLATPEDLWEDITEIDLRFIGLEEPHFYVPANHDEIMQDLDLFWYFNGSDTPVKMYNLN
jgi:hypothetical protein